MRLRILETADGSNDPINPLVDAVAGKHGLVVRQEGGLDSMGEFCLSLRTPGNTPDEITRQWIAVTEELRALGVLRMEFSA